MNADQKELERRQGLIKKVDHWKDEDIVISFKEEFDMGRLFVLEDTSGVFMNRSSKLLLLQSNVSVRFETQDPISDRCFSMCVDYGPDKREMKLAVKWSDINSVELSSVIRDRNRQRLHSYNVNKERLDKLRRSYHANKKGIILAPSIEVYLTVKHKLEKEYGEFEPHLIDLDTENLSVTEAGDFISKTWCTRKCYMANLIVNAYHDGSYVVLRSRPEPIDEILK